MEIFDYVDAKKKKEKEDRKFLIRHDYVIAQVIAENILSGFDSKVIPRSLWEIYPGIFEADRIQYEQQEELRQIEEAKENRRARARAMEAKQLEKEIEEMEKMEGGE